MFDKKEIICCPSCGQTQNFHKPLGNFDEASHCNNCNLDFRVSLDETKEVIEPDWRIIYCPICSVANQFWVRQKNQPFRCKGCKNKMKIKDLCRR